MSTHLATTLLTPPNYKSRIPETFLSDKLGDLQRQVATGYVVTRSCQAVNRAIISIHVLWHPPPPCQLAWSSCAVACVSASAPPVHEEAGTLVMSAAVATSTQVLQQSLELCDPPPSLA
eukprot:scaffold237531_cov34-Tisochrysis_lutea.AAC.2